MDFIKLETLNLHAAKKDSYKDLEFIKKLYRDDSIKQRFQGLLIGLFNDLQIFFNRGFLVSHNEEYVGYLNIGSFNEDEKSVYLRAAVDKDKRGFNYGKAILNEITEYIFKTYPMVESIRLKIARDNRASLMTANSCGYEWLENDLYIKYNPYLENKKTI